MSIRIVCDSSSNVFQSEDLNYTTVPMKINAGTREFVDAPGVDVQSMVDYLKEYKGKSGSSCPNVQDWLDAFAGADDIFGVTITKNLSGSYNSASQAAKVYMEEHPGARVFIFDSLSAGPELMMIVDKIRLLEAEGLDYETIKAQVLDYHNHCHTLFCLRSMMNLARNGRVHPAVAKIAGILNIRVVGDAEGGTIVPVQKPRGDKKALQVMVEEMEARGLRDGNLIRMSHCLSEAGAADLVAAIRAKYPNCRFIIEPTTALCSFYAEEGGVIVGFEGDFNEKNDNTKF